MENDLPTIPPDPVESANETLTIQPGDSPSTRREKKFLQQLSREQKVSLATFIFLFLAIPLTMVAVYGPTRFLPQAKTPKPPLEIPGLIPPHTPTPTPTPITVR